MRHIRQIQCKQKSVLGFTAYVKKELQTAILFSRATDGVRTRDPDLGKVVLYQLSHCRICYVVCVPQNNIYYTTGYPVCQQLF